MTPNRFILTHSSGSLFAQSLRENARKRVEAKRKRIRRALAFLALLGALVALYWVFWR